MGVTGGYRAGVIGTGFMGRVHSHAIRATQGQLVGIVGSAPARTAAAIAEFGAERAVADLEELLDADDVEVVHVCTPNHLHSSQTVAALKAGKHVVCEKPLTTTAADATEMVQAAAEFGLVGVVPFVYRFHPMVREARERVRRGDLGRLHLMHGSYLQDWLLLPTDDNWRVDPAVGGPLRAFGDIGSHWTDLAEFVTGDLIERVSAQTHTVVPERSGRAVATEDVVTLQFVTSGGVVGTSIISQVSPGRKNRLFLEVSGSDASLAFDQEQSELLWLGRRQGSSTLVRDQETLSAAAAHYATVPAGHPQGYQDCFNAFVADVASAVAGDPPDGLPTFADGLRAARVAEAVLESVSSGQWVEVAR